MFKVITRIADTPSLTKVGYSKRLFRVLSKKPETAFIIFCEGQLNLTWMRLQNVSLTR